MPERSGKARRTKCGEEKKERARKKNGTTRGKAANEKAGRRKKQGKGKTRRGTGNARKGGHQRRKNRQRQGKEKGGTRTRAKREAKAAGKKSERCRTVKGLSHSVERVPLRIDKGTFWSFWNRFMFMKWYGNILNVKDVRGFWEGAWTVAPEEAARANP